MKKLLCISFYLRTGTIRLHRSTIRGLNNPSFVRFLLSDDHKTLIVQPYSKEDFCSVRLRAYKMGSPDKSEIRSTGLCEHIARINGWGPKSSYRIYGKTVTNTSMAVFEFSSQEKIDVEKLIPD